MKLLVADDHTLFRDALVQYITRSDIDAQISVAKDLHEVMERMKEDSQWDLVLLDLYMPGMKGMKGFKGMRVKYPDVPLALMSGLAEEEDVREAIDLGAVGYFPKTLPGEALIKAIQLVLSGERFIPLDRNSSNIMPSYNGQRPGSKYYSVAAGKNSPAASQGVDVGLTPREAEVLTHLALGLSNKEIARILDLQVVTIKLHVRGICRKLNANNRTQAALKAHELGLVHANLRAAES